MVGYPGLEMLAPEVINSALDQKLGSLSQNILAGQAENVMTQKGTKAGR